MMSGFFQGRNIPQKLWRWDFLLLACNFM
jgi:hypothetical protein